ncbi:hypothetical protein LCGC14_1505780 [marine sediment metagenome]|uniref:Polysaccharide lyase 14 domain-containing protein n=1 Tax=marine sediment metagenome TaxID=412755 RepID=A0A0F9LI33_9ZZZZ
MRNILYILLLISGTVFGQTEFDDVTSTPSSSTSDETIIVRSGTTYRVTRAVQQDDLYDSIQISTDTAAVHDGKINTNIQSAGDNSDSIDASGVLIDANVSDISNNNDNLTTEIGNSAGTAGVTITFDGDTMIVSGGGTVMKFTKTSGTTVDTDPPVFSYGEIGNLGYDTVSMTFNESLTWATPDTVPFLCTVNLANAVLKGIYHVGDELRFKLDSSVSANQSVVMTYIQPVANRITDATGNYLQGFSTGVTNNVPSIGDTIDPVGWWKVNNDLTDEEGNYNGTGHNTPTFDASIKVGGSHAVNLNTSKAIDVGNVNMTDSFTIMFWWYGDRDPGASANIVFANRTDAANNDGVMIWISSWATDNGYIWFYTGNGSSQNPASCGQFVYDDTWVHIAITGDQQNGKAHIFVDGVERTSDSVTLNDYAFSGNATTWGSDNGHNEYSDGRFDDMRIYDRILTLEQIQTIYNNPEMPLSGADPGDDPLPDDSITVITNIEVSGMIYPYWWYLGGESDDYADDAGIAEHGGHKWFRSYHDINSCCVEYQTYIPSNGGSGILWPCWMNSDHDDFSHGYLTYTAKFPSDHVTGEGGKMPGVMTHEETSDQGTISPQLGWGSSIRTMHKYNAEGFVDIQWYIRPHLWGSYTSSVTHSRPGSGLPPGIIDRFLYDTEVRLTIRWYSGTVGQHNGFIEWFRDDVLIDQWTGLCFTEDAHINFDILTFDTFFGGSGTDWYAPSDTYWDIRDMVLFQYRPNQEGVPEYNEPSSPDRVLNQPTEAL